MLQVILQVFGRRKDSGRGSRKLRIGLRAESEAESCFGIGNHYNSSYLLLIREKAYNVEVMEVVIEVQFLQRRPRP